MGVAVVIVGMDGWQEYTLPAIESIKAHEPDADIIVMDCGKVQYPKHDGAKIVRIVNSPSYAYAMNKGVQAAGFADWYLFLNNDVLCQGKFMGAIDKVPKGSLYGRQIIEEKGYRWFGLWLALVSRTVWEQVGEWDERFLLCGFEDADYCIRAKHMGIDTLPIELPFHHYWGKTRWKIPNYDAIRVQNMDYLQQKHGVRLGDNVRVTHD